METEQPDIFIKETDYIIIVENRGHRVVVNIKKDKTTNMRKKKIKLRDLVGHPYNSTFEVDKNGAIKLVTDEEAGEPFEEENVEEAVDEEGDKAMINEDRSNQTMVDDNKAQKLTAEQIEQMKKEGVKGEKIIEKLLENSESFNKRTTFSQEKYLLKKKQKHLIQFKAYKPTLDSLVETYFLKNASYISNFRYDSFALFLQHSNIYPFSNVLLFDNTHGLLLGGIKQRLGSEGNVFVCSSRVDKQVLTEFRIVNELGYTNEDLNNVRFGAVKDLEAIQTPQFTHLLISSDADPAEILPAVLKSVIGGAVIVIYSNYIEPLGDCFDYLKDNSLGINMRINEVFSREQQVLPDRTHPHMMMQQFSGFILTANRVYN